MTFQPVDKGKEYFKRRIDFLTKQIEKIQPLLQEKFKMKEGKNNLPWHGEAWGSKLKAEIYEK